MTTFKTLPQTLAKNSSIKILGIDPGYDRCGISCIVKSGTKETLVFSDCISPPEKKDFTKRLAYIWNEISRVIMDTQPDCIAVEEIFSQKNVKTVIGVAQVVGLIRAQAFLHHIPLYVFSPSQIKSAVTGNGRASKTDIAHMLFLLLGIKKDKKILDDELDSIAVALTASAVLKNIHTLP